MQVRAAADAIMGTASAQSLTYDVAEKFARAALEAALPSALAAARAAGADDRRAAFVAGFAKFREVALQKFKGLEGVLGQFQLWRARRYD
jgi:hypothetical protein